MSEIQFWGIYERVSICRIQPVFADIHLMSLSDLETAAGRGSKISADTDKLYLHSDGGLLAQHQRADARGHGDRAEGDLRRRLLCVLLYAAFLPEFLQDQDSAARQRAAAGVQFLHAAHRGHV